MDELLGRREAPSVLPGKVADTKVDDLLPKRVRENPAVKDLNAHMAVGVAWLALTGFALGTGTLSALVSAVIAASKGSATVGGYVEVTGVFLSATALCLSVGAATWALLQGKLKSFGQLAVWALGTAALCAVLKTGGLQGPAGEEVLRQIDEAGGTPAAWVVGVFAAFVDAYGLLTVVSGAGIGVLAGHYVHRRTDGQP